MRIAICDDEENIRELLKSKILREYPEVDILFFRSGEELLLSNINIDILFLDIQMSGRNGIDIAKELRRKDKKMLLIFVTAMEEYVFQAFDVNAFNYIMKPIEDIKFLDVLSKAVNECSLANEDEQSCIIVNNNGERDCSYGKEELS